MVSEKRNTFLDAGDSEEEDDGHYESEADEVQKGGRGTKRRRLEDDDDDDDDESSDDDADIDIDDRFQFRNEEDDAGGKKDAGDEASARLKKQRKDTKRAKRDDSDEDEDEAAGEKADEADDVPRKDKKTSKLSKNSSAKDGDAARIELPGVNKPLTKKNLVASEKAVRRSGVVYLSRIPPFMKPAKLRSLLSPYGTINRIFLSPEDPLSHTRRVRGGGNKKRSYVDGWVEFVDKADAQRAVDLLNAQTIGGKKGTYYRDDLWTLVYLRGFKWHHLTEQIATENAERAGRMRAELEQTARENKAFLENVERAKMLDGMEAKAAAKAKATKAAAATDDAAEAPAAAPSTAAPAASQKGVRSIKQKKMVARADEGEQSEHVQRVLSKIF
ncbi:ESF2/ABP1 family protein [Sporothrix brasiliensis 5110]|uniref:18S rRNA factor 2 n=1 Tax=Sporothrix brasiliensis 5110 TaxID=1398154 RepID=A0A0C2IZX5_9PEZI|nr:ESF2/ABP1 family protein [Sporothrix brasiliensis 5110]KIH92305.1 ESF2/ABP1 family protein [Sporothrix brasiliensis 5110]